VRWRSCSRKPDFVTPGRAGGTRGSTIQYVCRVPCLHRFGGKHAACFTSFRHLLRLFRKALNSRAGQSPGGWPAAGRDFRVPCLARFGDKHASQRSPQDLSSLRVRCFSVPSPTGHTIYFDARRNRCPPFRAARPQKTLVSPPREKIALEFPTFRFFKTRDLRARHPQNHPATRPSIPPRQRASSPRFPASTPPQFGFATRFSTPKTGRKSKPALLTIRLRIPRNKPR
jgi:hypothetical protein